MLNLTNTQKFLVLITLFNLVMTGLFPPYDDVSINQNGVGVFLGFLFIFSQKSNNLLLNTGFLYLEITVILINVCILWLITIESKHKQNGMINLRNAAVVLVAINLIGVLLFPPFEYISHLTNAVIPTFEGFYFIFSHPPYRAIVTPLLYLEVFIVLINGCLLMLVFKSSQKKNYSAEDALAFAAKAKLEKRNQAF